VLGVARSDVTSRKANHCLMEKRPSAPDVTG